MNQRDGAIDFMKSILVILMILAHIVQFFPSVRIANIFSTYVNLTTFSGFMFTFGYVCYKAYISKNDNRLMKRLCKGFLRTICAYYVSGIAYTALIASELTLNSIIEVLLFKRIPGYSEFLLSFAFTYPLIYIWVKFGKKMKDVHYIILAGLSLFLTLIDYSAIRIPLLGVFIGTNIFSCFPIIQYMSYFIAGLYLASKNKIVDKCILLISCLGLLGFTSYLLFFGQLPKRFPPSAAWIVGGYLFVYSYFILSKKLSNYFSKMNFFFEIGAHSLAFLVISNLVIFILHRYLLEWYLSFPLFYKVILYLLVFVLCFGVSFIWNTVIKRTKNALNKLSYHM